MGVGVSTDGVGRVMVGHVVYGIGRNAMQVEAIAAAGPTLG